MIRLLTSLVDNLASLLLALVIAITIWVVAVQEADPRGQRRINDIPVQVVGRPVDSEVLGLPENVEIVVEGPVSILDQLTADDFTAPLDLSGIGPGETEIPLAIQYDAETVDLVWQSLEDVTVDVERTVTRDIPVRVELRGTPARGYEVGDPLIEPETITVSGIASRVEALAEARTSVYLDSPEQDLSVDRRPIFYDRQGNITSITGLDLATDEVQVTVPVNQLAGYAAKPVIVDWEGEPASGYRLLNVNVEPDSVLLTGPPEQLDALRRVRTEPIDITGLRESDTMQVSLDLPPGIEIDEVQPILVEVEIEPILTSSVIRKTPEVRALSEGLTMTMDVEEVRVFLFGPLDRLDSLVEEDVRVTLDLFGLEPGTYTLEPDADVSVSDVEVRSIQPEQITVNITNTITTTEGITATATPTTTSGLPISPLPTATGAHLPVSVIMGLPAALIPAGLTLFRRERAS